MSSRVRQQYLSQPNVDDHDRLTVWVAAARGVPAEKPAEDAVKRPDTFQEGTVLIPGIGRYELGTHYIPDIGGLDHSIPAAANGQFIPGADDTWVPNPGLEVPNPFRPASTESP